MRHATPRILTPWASSRRDLRIYPLPNQSAVCALSESGEILSLSLLFQFSPIPVPPPVSVLRCCVGCDPPPRGGRDCAAVRSPRSPLPCVPSDAGVIPHQLTTSVPSPYHHRTSTSTMPSPHHHRAITVPSPCHLRTITVPPPYQYQHHAIAPPPPCHHRAITVPSPYRHRTTVAVVPPSDHYSPIG